MQIKLQFVTATFIAVKSIFSEAELEAILLPAVSQEIVASLPRTSVTTICLLSVQETLLALTINPSITERAKLPFCLTSLLISALPLLLKEVSKNPVPIKATIPKIDMATIISINVNPEISDKLEVIGDKDNVFLLVRDISIKAQRISII